MSSIVSGAAVSKSTPVTSSVARAWLAVAALGAGLLHLATAPGAPLPVLVLLVALGAGEVAWCVATFARDAVPFARPMIFAALLPLGCWAALATFGATYGATVLSASLPPLPLGVASLLDLSISITLAVSMRRAAGTRSPSVDAAGFRFVAALVLGAALVTVVTVPALSTTSAGAHAVDAHLLHLGAHHH